MSDQQKNQGVTDEQVADLRAREAEDLAQMMANKYKLPYIDLSRTLINTDALRLITETDAREAGIVAFHASGKNISVAVDAPNQPKTQEVLTELQTKNFVVTVYITSRGGL